MGAGLGFVNRRGRLQDAFRGRVLFPICDSSGRPVAIGGRVLPGSSDPAKYKNSQESVIYSKRKVLYGLNWAKADIIASDEVVVCEGYTDVIGFFEAGVERAVATCGTAMADEHFGVLRNFAKRVVLAYDADGAGQAAAGRFYEWERRHEIDVAVADLPPGADPGELSRSDPEALRAAVQGAKPFLQFRLERVLSGADLSTPEGRAKAADAALSAVSEHPDDLVRDMYLMQVAERCRLEPASLRDRLERLRREGPKDPAPKRPGSPGRSSGDDGPSWVRDPDDPWDRGAPDGDEDASGFDDEPRWRQPAPSFGPGLEALKLAIHRPEEVAHRLEPVLFGDELQRSALGGADGGRRPPCGHRRGTAPGAGPPCPTGRGGAGGRPRRSPVQPGAVGGAPGADRAGARGADVARGRVGGG